MVRRAEFLTAAMNLIGTPYKWGGRSPEGLDCWGLPAYCIYRLGGVKLYDWWTDMAFAKLPELRSAEQMVPGDLVFYGGKKDDAKDVDHVVIWLGMGMVLSASGGSARITTPEEALKFGAKVRAWDSWLYRKDVKGFRSLAPYLAG